MIVDYDITDHPNVCITNAQMIYALTCKRLFPANDTYVCSDEGNYIKGHIYRIVVNENTKSWDDITAYIKGGTFDGNIVITGNLTVQGTTVSENTQSLTVKDNIIVTNSDKIDLQSKLSGLAINKNSVDTYGIVYDPVDDTVKLGLGNVNDDGNFAFDTGEGAPMVIRDDSSKLVNEHLVQWDSTNNKIVDSGKSINDLASGLTILQDSDFPLSANLLAKLKANPQNYCYLKNNYIYLYDNKDWTVGGTIRLYQYTKFLFERAERGWGQAYIRIREDTGAKWTDINAYNNTIITLNTNTIKYLNNASTVIGVKAENANQIITGDDILTGMKGNVKTVTYDNTTLADHIDEILGYVNTENGGNLINVNFKVASAVNGEMKTVTNTLSTNALTNSTSTVAIINADEMISLTVGTIRNGSTSGKKVTFTCANDTNICSFTNVDINNINGTPTATISGQEIDFGTGTIITNYFKGIDILNTTLEHLVINYYTI